MIPVTKPYLPDITKYRKYLDGIYDRAWLTNSGPLVQELTARLEDYLGTTNLLLVANGTMALQVAYRTLGIQGSAVTTPFTFAATAGSLKWQSIEPIFVDIDPQTLNLRPDLAERAIRSDTTALVPVHVYGNPCAVDDLGAVATRNDLKLIYDAAHTFGVKLNGECLLNWGDAATLSFHATKIFHTVEGGAVRFADREDYERARAMINFGLDPASGEMVEVGCNAKMSEVHAAMGLAMLDDIDRVIERRQEIVALYERELSDCVDSPAWNRGATRNGAYVPVLFETSAARTLAEEALREDDVKARRYFSPSLAELSLFDIHGTDKCDEATQAAARVLCLPIYPMLEDDAVIRIAALIRKSR